MKLALSMIVRDAGQDLDACLRSVQGIVDEIVIADTGSIDNSIEIAQRHGARVASIEWTNDFAAARNRALDLTDADWVLSMDADERIDPATAHTIRAMMKREEVDGYLVPIRNYVLSLEDRLWNSPAQANDGRLAESKIYPAFVIHENVRLFRRRPHIRFSGRVHESVGPQIVAAGGKIAASDFCLHHFGLASNTETRARKNRLYRELGKQKVAEMPANAQAHLELGIVELDNFHNYPEALHCFQKACALDPRFRVAFFFAGIASLQLGRAGDALRYLEEAERLGDRSSLLLEAKGDAYYNLQKFSEAVAHYRRSIKQASLTPALESKLGLAELRAGSVSEGLKKLQRAIARQTESAGLHDRLVAALVFLGRLPEAAEAAEKRLRSAKPDASAFLRAASIRGHMGDWPETRSLLSEGIRLFPQSAALQDAALEVSNSLKL